MVRSRKGCVADLCDRKGLTIAYDDMWEKKVRGDAVGLSRQVLPSGSLVVGPLVTRT